jgi:hypothetical protein
MHMQKQAKQACASAWFAALERARLTSNHDLAARAKRELARRGVRVEFTARTARKREVSNAPRK